MALVGPAAVPDNPFALVGRPFAEPFGKFLLGTDSLGRDVTAGIIHGARTSLLIGAACRGRGDRRSAP